MGCPWLTCLLQICLFLVAGESLPEIDEKEEDRRRKEALPQEKKVVPQEKGVLPQEKEVLPQEKGVLPQEKGVLPQEKEVLPQEKGVLPQEKAMGDKQLPVQHNNGANTDVLVSCFIGSCLCNKYLLCILRCR